MKTDELLRKGERVTKISIVALVATGVILLLVGFLSGSIAMRGSGIDTLGDASVSLIVLIGLRLLHRPPDEKFQYGYYKIETFVSMVVSVFLIVIGGWLFYISYLSFISPRQLDFPLVALVVSFASAALFFALAVYKRRIAVLIDSLAMKTDASNSMISGLASTIVSLGLALSYLGVYHADAVAGMAVAVLTFTIAYIAIKESSLILLDVCTCPGVRGNIKDIAVSVKGVKEVHEVLLRKSGPYVMGEMHIKIDGRLSVYEAHEIIERIEMSVKEKVPLVGRLTIKIEPAKGKN